MVTFCVNQHKWWKKNDILGECQKFHNYCHFFWWQCCPLIWWEEEVAFLSNTLVILCPTFICSWAEMTSESLKFQKLESEKSPIYRAHTKVQSGRPGQGEAVVSAWRGGVSRGTYHIDRRKEVVQRKGLSMTQQLVKDMYTKRVLGWKESPSPAPPVWEASRSLNVSASSSPGRP